MQIELFKVERKEAQSTEEVWVPCPGFPKYLVSSLGRFKQAESGRLMTVARFNNGYLMAKLTKDGKQTAALSHRLVCKAFHGDGQPGRDLVNHIDGDRANNKASNLEWVSRSENAHHALSLAAINYREELRERYVTCHNSV